MPRTSFTRLLPICCLICFICFFGSYMRIPIVPLYALSLGADSAQVGMINASFLLLAGLLSIPAGLLSDRLGRRGPILGGLLILAGSSFLLYFCRTPLQIAGIYPLFGIGLAAFAPTLMSYVADVTPVAELGRAYGWYTMALFAGMTAGPATGGFVGQALGLRQVFLVSGISIFAVAVFAYFYLPTQRPSSENGKKPLLSASLPRLFGNRRLLACLLATLGGCYGSGMFVTFMPVYIREHGMDAGHVGLVFATQALANSLSRIPSGQLCDRVTDRSVLVIAGLAAFAVSLAAFAFSTTLVPLMICSGAFGISMGIAFTALGALIAEVVPIELRGLAMGSFNTCIYLGMMLGSAATGVVIREDGFRCGFFLTGGIALAVTLLFAIIYRKPAARRPERA